MANLRKRHLSQANGHGNREPLENSDQCLVGPEISTPLSYRTYVVLASVALSCAAIFLYNKLQQPPLPESYAVCSRTGNRLYTVDDEGSRVQCLAVHNSLIIATGSLDEVKERWNNHDFAVQETNALGNMFRPPLLVRYIDEGSIIIPGMSDSHAHILEYGASRMMDLEGAKTIEGCVAAVRCFILSHPDVKNDTSKFIEGWGWDHTSWPAEEWPTAADFDKDLIVQGRPVVLQSKDGHALWVSSSVIQLSLPFPTTIEGGMIVRDSSGKPIGVFIDNAQELIKKPDLTDADLERRFAITVERAVASGLTSIHDAGFDPMSLEFFKRQAEASKLPIRIYGMTYFDENGEYWGNKSKPIINGGNGRLGARSVKIFADGALRSGGAALHEPYSDNPGFCGVMRLETHVLNSVVPRFLRDGWQVNIHAVGDRANGIVLDTFEAALMGVNVTASRPRIEHCQIMTRADMARLGKLGVIASVQPTHAISDMWYAQDRLGPERVKGLYAFRSLLDSGARISFGSDAPVEDLNPLSGFYAATTRLSPSGQSPHGPDGWFPEQRLTRDEALRGMTIDPAYASFTESTLGSLAPGKIADFVVLSQDIMSIPTNQILRTKVVATVIDGRPIYGGI
ncbi:hypothetical protein PILCRDRAFT_809968 [Piloderma croceum F 1598]|uniref:Amidohydrolase 3 domain-containing protein n=1 Tax=Piloderma croceum (strain F 1598) TaxID=765440 RepID=A0A0C3GN58_PILCF|nr:hypothetical protein PILCRDRAFT_809968 [Piloderma croceum F 1598]